MRAGAVEDCSEAYDIEAPPISVQGVSGLPTP